MPGKYTFYDMESRMGVSYKNALKMLEQAKGLTQIELAIHVAAEALVREYQVSPDTVRKAKSAYFTDSTEKA